MASKKATATVTVRYDERIGCTTIAGPGGFTQVWVPRVSAEAIATALGLTLEVSGS